MSLLGYFLCLIIFVINGANIKKEIKFKGHSTCGDGLITVGVTMDTIGNTVTLTLIGPATVYYSVGFGGTSMDDVYSIIINEDVQERYLNGYNSGTLLSTSSWTTESNTVSGIFRTVVLTRVYDEQSDIDDDRYYTFNEDICSDGVCGDNIVWALGSSLVYEMHEIADSSSMEYSLVEAKKQGILLYNVFIYYILQMLICIDVVIGNIHSKWNGKMVIGIGFVLIMMFFIVWKYVLGKCNGKGYTMNDEMKALLSADVEDPKYAIF